MFCKFDKFVINSKAQSPCFTKQNSYMNVESKENKGNSVFLINFLLGW